MGFIGSRPLGEELVGIERDMTNFLHHEDGRILKFNGRSIKEGEIAFIELRMVCWISLMDYVS